MTMWAQDRQQRILLLLAAQRQLSTEHLARELQISRETLRRDLVGLEDAGKLSRVHGGVTLAGPREEVSFTAPRAVHHAEQKRMAAAASELVRPGECCFIEAGSATAALARVLASVPDLAVITNSLEVASIMRAGRTDADVTLLGGQVAEEDSATYGELTLQMVGQFSADIAVLAPAALHGEQGAMSRNTSQAALGRAMVARAGRLIMLADSAKLGQTSRAVLAKCDDIDVLVTDTNADQAKLDALAAAGVGRILTA